MKKIPRPDCFSAEFYSPRLFRLPQQNTTDWVVYKQQKFIYYS